MKVTSKYKTIGFALVLGAFTFSCNQETVNEDINEGVNATQTELNEEAIETRRDFEQFQAWMQNNLRRAETATREEWNEIRAEYQHRKEEIEAQSANWDEETRQEWEELKAEWNEAEKKVRERLGEIDDVDVDVDVDVNRQNN